MMERKLEENEEKVLELKANFTEHLSFFMCLRFSVFMHDAMAY
jgi:hypothetical protein